MRSTPYLAGMLASSLVLACHGARTYPHPDAHVDDGDDGFGADPDDMDDVDPAEDPDALRDAGADAARPWDASPPSGPSRTPDAASSGFGGDAAVDADAGSADASAGSSFKGGDSFENARRIEADAIGPLVDTTRVDQTDYFVFRAEAGSYYELTTDNSTFTPDNVLSLYDSQRKLIAQNDDGALWNGDGIDARLVVRIPKSGDYYVKVEDPYTSAEFFDSGFSLLYYHLKVRSIAKDTPGFSLASAAITQTTFKHDDTSNYDYVTLVGTFGPGTTSFSFAGIGDKALIAHVALGGADNDGSTYPKGRVSLARAGDARVLGQIDRGIGQENLHPPIGMGSYVVKVDADSGALGENPYFSIDVVQFPENPGEQAEQANNLIAGAEAVALTGARAKRGLLLARLPAGDVDYYRFDAMQGQGLRVACEAESAGSGVRGLSAEIRTAGDATLATATETRLDNLRSAPVMAPAAGTYYLRLSSATTDPASIEPWVRCVILIGG